LLTLVLLATMNSHERTLRLVQELRQQIVEIVNRSVTAHKDQDFVVWMLIEKVDECQKLMTGIDALKYVIINCKLKNKPCTNFPILSAQL
jgi:hypothetical protein